MGTSGKNTLLKAISSIWEIKKIGQNRQWADTILIQDATNIENAIKNGGARKDDW